MVTPLDQNPAPEQVPPLPVAQEDMSCIHPMCVSRRIPANEHYFAFQGSHALPAGPMHPDCSHQSIPINL